MQKMLQKLTALTAAFGLCAMLAACGAAAPSSEAPAASTATVEAAAPSEAPEAATPEAGEEDFYTSRLSVAGLKGPTTMGLVNLIEWSAQESEIDPEKVTTIVADQSGESIVMDNKNGRAIDFTMYGAADEIVPLLVRGELDAAALPANLAATLYQKTNGALKVACINTLGVLYIVEKGDTVKTVADLAGQTIVTTGKGTTPEYVLRYLLSQNGLDPDKDVTIEYASEATEALAQIQAGTATIAMLPQPFVTSALSQVEGLRVALDMNTEWEAVAGSKLVTGVLVVQSTLADSKDTTQLDAFLNAYADSVAAANTDLETTAALCEQYGIVPKAALAQKALPQCNIVFETGDEMVKDLTNYYHVLFDADPASVGGALPDFDFYYDFAG